VVVKVFLRFGSGKKAFKILSGKIRSDRFLINNMKKFLLERFEQLKYSQSIAFKFSGYWVELFIISWKGKKKFEEVELYKRERI
jgi:hypothetical protein